MAILSDFGVSGTNPSFVVVRDTLTHYFPRILGSVIGAVPNTPSATDATGQLLAPGNNELNGQMVRIQLAGNVHVGSFNAPTTTVSLLANTGSAVSPNYVSLATATASLSGGSTGINVPWSIEAVISGDSSGTTFLVNPGPGSGTIQGQYSALFNGAYHNTAGTNAWVPLDNTLSGINFSPTPGQVFQTGQPSTLPYPFGLVVSVVFTSTNVFNAAKLTQFRIIAD